MQRDRGAKPYNDKKSDTSKTSALNHESYHVCFKRSRQVKVEIDPAQGWSDPPKDLAARARIHKPSRSGRRAAPNRPPHGASEQEAPQAKARVGGGRRRGRAAQRLQRRWDSEAARARHLRAGSVWCGVPNALPRRGICAPGRSALTGRPYITTEGASKGGVWRGPYLDDPYPFGGPAGGEQKDDPRTHSPRGPPRPAATSNGANLKHCHRTPSKERLFHMQRPLCCRDHRGPGGPRPPARGEEDPGGPPKEGSSRRPPS